VRRKLDPERPVELATEAAMARFDLGTDFSAEALHEARRYGHHVDPAEAARRIDLRDTPLVTIDGEDARDFDDAVYCEPQQLGRGKNAAAGWRLVVAIADVSHYVKPGEPIDDDAYERATSVYFPRRVIPMLPEKLSNGLCSLNPEQERLSMVCDMVVDGHGAITAYQFYPALICSQARFTYTEVAAILGNTRGPEAQRRSELVPHLIHLHEVYRALLKHRGTRGAVDFETTETQIVADENGRIERIEPRKRNEAHRLIEEAMLAANVCAAEFIADHGHPALYRVHEGPTPEKKTLLQNYLKAEPRLQAVAHVKPRCTLAFDCLAQCGLRDGLASWGQFCIDKQLAAALRGDVKKGLFFSGKGALPFGDQIRSVRDLLTKMLSPPRTAFAG
jgi:ribonuclease R